jgi:hypothetical protein
MKTKSKGIKLKETLYNRLAEIAVAGGMELKSIADIAVEDFLNRVEKDGTIDVKLRFGTGKTSPGEHCCGDVTIKTTEERRPLKNLDTSRILVRRR